MKQLMAGGGVALILSLFGAKITLIATDAQEEAVRLADRYLKREFEDQDLQAEEYALVVAATDDRLLNEQIHLLACTTRFLTHFRGRFINIISTLKSRICKEMPVYAGFQ